MALQKSFENASGNQGDHWEIASIHINNLDDSLEVRWALFKSSADFSAGKRRMEETKSIIIEPLPASMNGLITSIVASSKITPATDQLPTDTPFFDGATNV